MRNTIFMLLFCFILTPTAYAESTNIAASIGAGDAGTVSYNLGIKHYYAPWISNDVGELTPTSELGATLWTYNSGKIWGGYLAPGLRYSMFVQPDFVPFIGGSVGGSIISDNKFKDKDLGSHLLLRTTGNVGVNFGSSLQHSLSGEYTYYSNLGLAKENDGYSTYGLNYGYSF